MRKKKVFATAAIAALAAAQMAMPVMAAKTNNDKEDLSADKSLEQELKDNGHTTFKVFESENSVVDGQVSFEVPLYVTMAAVKGDAELKVPTGYYIKNTNAEAANNPIGVINIDVKPEGWSIVSERTAPSADKEMQFTLGDVKFKAATAGGDVVNMYNWDNETEKNVFLDSIASYTDLNSKTHNKVYQITDKLDLNLAGKVQQLSTRKNSNTVAAFKVVYTIAAIDPTTGQPKGATYVGDSKDASEKYMIPGIYAN